MSSSTHTRDPRGSAAPDAAPTAIELPIVEVTVLEDRARIRRRGTLPAGTRGVLSLLDVATTILDRTLFGSLQPASGSRVPIGSLRVERTQLHEPSALPEELAALERTRERADDTVVALEAALRELATHAAALGRVGALAAADTTLDAGHGVGDVDLWRERYVSLGEAVREAREERVALEAQLEEALAERASIDRALGVKAQSSTRARASIVFAVSDVHVPCEVEIEYVVANACWRPLHRAELTEAGSDAIRGRLTFRTDGCIWQHTGEDWPDVALVLSTERSARDAAPPLLATDRLAVRRKSPVTTVAIRTEEIATTGSGMGASAPSTTLPGVDDGGVTQRLTVPGRTSVRSDGRPHRAALAGFETDAALSLRAVPEVIAAVLRCSRQTNASATPLLAGPVELLRNGGFIGRTAIELVSPGERFELGWGPEGSLRVVREESARTGDGGLLSSQRVTRVDRTLRISNLGAQALTLEVLERIPVSELQKVKITLDPQRSQQGATADEDGMVRLPVKLPPRGHAVVTLGFELRAGADVVGLPY